MKLKDFNCMMEEIRHIIGTWRYSPIDLAKSSYMDELSHALHSYLIERYNGTEQAFNKAVYNTIKHSFHLN